MHGTGRYGETVDSLCSGEKGELLTYVNGATFLFFKVWGLAYGQSRDNQTLRSMGYQIFLGMGLRSCAFGPREIRYNAV